MPGLRRARVRERAGGSNGTAGAAGRRTRTGAAEAAGNHSNVSARTSESDQQDGRTRRRRVRRPPLPLRSRQVTHKRRCKPPPTSSAPTASTSASGRGGPGCTPVRRVPTALPTASCCFGRWLRGRCLRGRWLRGRWLRPAGHPCARRRGVGGRRRPRRVRRRAAGVRRARPPQGDLAGMPVAAVDAACRASEGEPACAPTPSSSGCTHGPPDGAPAPPAAPRSPLAAARRRPARASARPACAARRRARRRGLRGGGAVLLQGPAPAPPRTPPAAAVT